jgi:phosphoenolpyruvate-protein phosphotransferase (PTS system enzyme I)
MNKLEGLTASDGSAVGPLFIREQSSYETSSKQVTLGEVPQEIRHYQRALEAYEHELEQLLVKLKGTASEIIKSQSLILQDEQIKAEIINCIRTNVVSASYAIDQIYELYIGRLRDSASNLFRQRIIDLITIKDRLVKLAAAYSEHARSDHQEGISPELPVSVDATPQIKGCIVVARDLSPTEVVQLSESKAVGIILEKGGLTAHAAIVAQSLNIPCLVQIGSQIHDIPSGKIGIIDGEEGVLLVDPSPEIIRQYNTTISDAQAAKKKIKPSRLPAVTKDGVRVQIHANIEFIQELPMASSYRAEGIGLVRTEGLLYGGLTHKSEKEQDVYYRRLLDDCTGPVVIRLFDVGGDKLYGFTTEESNPFLGWRGIRMLLDEKEMLHSQLRSILKCTHDYPGRIRILVPMVTNIEEIHLLKKELSVVQSELAKEGFSPVQDVPLGIMVEVPAVAVMADKFAKEVDFFSIGTNDLTQYTLAVDRTNDQVGRLFEHDHPAIWKLVQQIQLAAHKAGIGVSVCGELASTLLGASGLIGLGIRNLSMKPSAILSIKKWIQSYSVSEFQLFGSKIVQAQDREQVHQLFSTIFHRV